MAFQSQTHRQDFPFFPAIPSVSQSPTLHLLNTTPFPKPLATLNPPPLPYLTPLGKYAPPANTKFILVNATLYTGLSLVAKTPT